MWFFPFWEEFQFGDEGYVQPSSTAVIEVLTEVIDKRSRSVG